MANAKMAPRANPNNRVICRSPMTNALQLRVSRGNRTGGSKTNEKNRAGGRRRVTPLARSFPQHQRVYARLRRAMRESRAACLKVVALGPRLRGDERSLWRLHLP